MDALLDDNAEQRNDALNKRAAFISAVKAQAGNDITEAQAEEVISAAMNIMATLP